MRVLALIAAIFILLGVCSAHADKTELFLYNGGPQHTGVYDTKPLTRLTGLKWKFDTAGAVTSPPLVYDGIVYFGDWKGFFYAVDVSAGTLRWKKGGVEAGAGPPTIYHGLAYWGSREGTFYALDARTGQEIWRFKTGAGVKSSPLVADGMVYFGGEDGYFYAVR